MLMGFSHPQRDTRSPTHLKECISHAITHPTSKPLHENSSGMSHPLSYLIFDDRFSPQYRAFLAAITSNNDLQHFSQAIQHP